MILRLKPNDFLRLLGARGVAIEVLRGGVWITEEGVDADQFLRPGQRYRVERDGLVLIGTEAAGTEEPAADLRVTAPSAGTAAPALRAASAHPG